MKPILGKAAFDAQDPTKLVPHGDRLLIEEVEVEDATYITDGAGNRRKVVIARAVGYRSARDPNPSPSSDELTELARGWKLGRVVCVGNGHRLEHNETVPMPFERGDYVYFERMTGRELDFQGTKYRIINQIDVLLHAPEVKNLLALQTLDTEPVFS